MIIFIIYLLIPLLMTALGMFFLKKPPKKINWFFGYRTTMSMKNRETWGFAHKYVGKIWLTIGLIMLIVSAAITLIIFNKDSSIMKIVGEVLLGVQIIPFIISVFPTEKALRSNFDNNGNRR